MIEFTVNGMTCGGCARAVTNAVQQVDQAANVVVDLPNKKVTVDSSAGPADIQAAIEVAGYQVERLPA